MKKKEKGSHKPDDTCPPRGIFFSSYPVHTYSSAAAVSNWRLIQISGYGSSARFKTSDGSNAGTI